MAQQEIINRLTMIFHDIFNPSVVVSEDLDATKVPEWDSLKHISLIVAIEGEFQCELSTEEVAQARNVGDLIKLLEGKWVNGDP
jgi:acyl carrier protein